MTSMKFVASCVPVTADFGSVSSITPVVFVGILLSSLLQEEGTDDKKGFSDVAKLDD